MRREIFDKNLIEKFLVFMQSRNFEVLFEAKKNQLVYYSESEALMKLRLPLDLEFDPEKNQTNLLDFKHYVLVLIRSGIAAVGYFENFINTDHKVFRAYMVRKKQGKSQIKYLKTKGKSRAGSRVRLSETLEFFEEINIRLSSYFKDFRVDQIGITCSETLMPYLFGSKEETPFDKKDPRIFKIPKHIQNPTYEELLKTNDFLLSAEIKYNDKGEELWKDFLASVDEKNEKISPEDNW
ncbi:hypothetical protein P872_04675 [Rhodonellum psychrophilum GCM71 = DSM 17998]|uniref:VLRF1 domain-containing protein n=2 Tax=Rhodonellum TaxID=336827 RepID=U5C341_9BACT|nr:MULTISPECIES: hypothetical protein [Rhodonellum]ERM82612.1 hypothetical protein P872_04675 [Rhodonellum psychrophilum GCM71 = DSM 17998]MDO9553919.1 hypothetical protein [Rhodonellum sp.]SDZ53599.1 hypothetical protein SAMN05444412_12147 [Rhodonellum ikkaensis]